jgi:type III restriction enzyme
VHWLDKQLHQPDIMPAQLVEYLRRTVRDLLARSDLDLATLVRHKFALEKTLEVRIKDARKAAVVRGFQQMLDLGMVVTHRDFDMTFDPVNYPANTFYGGSYKFKKHYYPAVGDLNKEEEECAFAIDCHPLVEHWVRNIERQPKYSFSLQTSTDRFYPDFVVKLTDGRTLVVEYKGAQFRETPDVLEKTLIGQKWADASGNLFLMGWAENGGKIAQQIDRLLSA